MATKAPIELPEAAPLLVAPAEAEEVPEAPWELVPVGVGVPDRTPEVVPFMLLDMTPELEATAD